MILLSITVAAANTFLTFGDSITQAGAQNGSKFCNVTADYLNWSGQYPDIVCDNQGIGGTCMSDRPTYCSSQVALNGVERYNSDIIGYEPKIVNIMYGTNDLGYDAKLDAFVEDYQEVISAVKADASIEFILLNTITYGWFTNYSQENQTIWNIAVQQLAITNKLPIAQTAWWMNKNQTLLNDKVHPNEAGGIHISKILNKTIAENNVMSSARWDVYFNNNQSYVIEDYTFHAPALNASWGIPAVNWAEWVKVQNVTQYGMTIDFEFIRSHPVVLAINTSAKYIPNYEYIYSDNGAISAITADANGRINLEIATTGEDHIIGITTIGRSVIEGTYLSDILII